MFDSDYVHMTAEYADPDLAVDWIQFFIQDPKDLDENNYPKTIYRVHAFLKKFHHTLFTIDKTCQPISKLLDQEIVSLLFDDLQYGSVFPKALEFSLKRIGKAGPSAVIYNCSRCSGGLNIDFCHGCQAEFEDDLVRAAWQFPLPKKIVNLLIDQGHQFDQDPQVAYKEEKQAAEFPIFGLEEQNHENNYHTP